MKALKRKELVLSIIKDDLINSKLVYGLDQLGLDADDYTLYASSTIMQLMRFRSTGAGRRWEQIHEEYLERSKKVLQLDIQGSHYLLEALAKEIYQFLKSKRKEEKAFRLDRSNNQL